jgi:ubiquinone/menaquinone biosynthesis C-methylase UbiE
VQDHIETQRQQWNQAAPAWEKWESFLDRNMAFLNYRLVGDARIGDGHAVLDLGSGTGHPAVLIARAIGESGSVIGLDLAAEMLAVARKKAKSLGLNNLSFQEADITNLPLESNRFDAVTSRFCLMFLPDIPKALSEIARVLKPGGYLAAAVWSDPKKNPFIQLPNQVLSQFVELPPPPPDQPGIFRLAAPGELAGMVDRAGLQTLAEEEIEADSPYESADEYFHSLMDMAAPLKPIFEKLTPVQRARAESEIKSSANRYLRGNRVAMPMAIRIVTARKPA